MWWTDAVCVAGSCDEASPTSIGGCAALRASGGTVWSMANVSSSCVDPVPSSPGFGAEILTGLLDAGVPQRFLRALTDAFASPDEWRAAGPLPGEDPLWRKVPPRDPGCGALVKGSAEYPWALRALPAPPVLLYVDAAEACSPPVPTVCVSGSRSMGLLGRNVVDVVVDEMASIGASLVCGTEAGVEEYAVRSALVRGVPTTLVSSSGFRAENERAAGLHQDVRDAGGTVVSPFAADVRESAFTRQASSRILAAFASPLVLAEASVPSAATAMAADALRVGSPILVPLPRRGFRDAAGARGLLALADVEHARLLGWGEEFASRRGLNGFANAVAETGEELRTMLRVFWWLRPRQADDVDLRSANLRRRVEGT